MADLVAASPTNFMNGDAFGHPTGADFGILYPSTTLAYHTYGAQPLWPAEVWECQGDLIILGLLLWYSCFKHARGTTFCLYIMLYSLLRFFLENTQHTINALEVGDDGERFRHDAVRKRAVREVGTFSVVTIVQHALRMGFIVGFL